MSVNILTGDCRAILPTLPDCSVQCCVTSVPYFGLRSYLPKDHPDKPKEMGLEPTLTEYIAEMVGVFREVKRVLREDGVLWLNIGDSYARDAAKGQHKPGDSGKQDYIVTDGGGRAAGGMKFRLPKGHMHYLVHMNHCNQGEYEGSCCYGDDAVCPTLADFIGAGLKPKDLMMVPARLAIALQDDGWWLRSDIIWAKPNPMPESVQDRPTSAHEHVLMLTKAARYYYDADAVRERPSDALLKQIADGYSGADTKDFTESGAQSASGTKARIIANARAKIDKQRGHSRRHAGFNDRWDSLSKDEQCAVGSNLRNVWAIASEPFPGSHFAVMPSALAERCIKAGSRPGDTILDPFSGAGTTALVAGRLGRNAIGIDLNPAYFDMSRDRISDDAGLFAEFV